MVLFDKDIKELKKFMIKIRNLASDCDDLELCIIFDRLIYVIERYQDYHDWDYHDKHERKAYSFMMRFAERLRDKDIAHAPEFSLFENEFLSLLDDYPSLQHRFIERIRGDKN